MDALKWGVKITTLKCIETPQGRVLHGIKRSNSTFVEFGEAYFSSIFPGAIKGWKKHNKMTLNLVVPVGLVRFVIFENSEFGDIELNSEPIDVVLGSENYSRLTIPPGLWVGFQGVSDEESLLLNVASHEHDPSEVNALDLTVVDFDWSI